VCTKCVHQNIRISEYQCSLCIRAARTARTRVQDRESMRVYDGRAPIGKSLGRAQDELRTVFGGQTRAGGGGKTTKCSHGISIRQRLSLSLAGPWESPSACLRRPFATRCSLFATCPPLQPNSSLTQSKPLLEPPAHSLPRRLFTTRPARLLQSVIGTPRAAGLATPTRLKCHAHPISEAADGPKLAGG